MVNINLDPILLRWGPITVAWHGLCIVVAVVLIYLIIIREGAPKGFSRQLLTEFAVWFAVLGIFGARILHLLEHWRFYMDDPSRILAFQKGGVAVSGAIIGGIVATISFARWRRLDFWELVDVLVIAAPLGSIVARIGCTINGDVWGVPTNGSWGVVYLHKDAAIPSELLDVPLFPAATVLQLWNFGLFILLIVVRDRAPFSGFLFPIYLVVYSFGRIIVSIWQSGEEFVLGLRFSQAVYAGLILLGVVLMIYLRRSQKQPGLAK